MKWTPQAIVAIILSSCVFAVFIGNIITQRVLDVDTATLWSDLLKVMVGGLIGYIMSGNKNE